MLIKDYREELFNVEESLKNQREIVKNGRPAFAPWNGVCYNCKKNIYTPIFKKLKNDRYEIVPKEEACFVSGVSIEESKKLVTGCPHCHYSYCD